MFVEDRVDVFDPVDVEQWMVIAWKDSLKQAGLSQPTINQKLSALSAFYTVAIEQHLVDVNPVDGVKRQNVNPYGKATFLNTEEIKAFLGAIDQDTLQGKRDYALIAILLTTGVRVSAVANARIRDIEQRGGQWVLRYENKGGSEDAARITSLMPTIQTYLDLRDDEIMPDAPLFIATPRGQKATIHSTLVDEYISQPLTTRSIRKLVLSQSK